MYARWVKDQAGSPSILGLAPSRRMLMPGSLRLHWPTAKLPCEIWSNPVPKRYG